MGDKKPNPFAAMNADKKKKSAGKAKKATGKSLPPFMKK